LKIQKVRLNSIKGGEKEEGFYRPVVLLILLCYVELEIQIAISGRFYMWVAIVVVVFIGAVLLVSRVYTAKGKKPEGTSQTPAEGTGDSSEGGGEE
jgi:hypothetical protein